MSKYKLLLCILFPFLISCSQIENNSQSPITVTSQTPVSIEASATVQPIHTVTSTPVFNGLGILLTSNPDNQSVFSLLENPLCKLPCWWTIIPGETTWNDTKKVLQLLNETPTLYEKDEDYSAYDVTYYVSENSHFINLRLHINKNIVEYISINNFIDQADINSRFKMYSPKNIVEEYGVPSRIYLRTYINNKSYSMSLFYDEKSFLITYAGTITNVGYQNRICFNTINDDIKGIGINLQSSKLETLIDFYPKEKKIFDIERYSWVPVFEVTGLTVAEFSKLILENEDICFEVK